MLLVLALAIMMLFVTMVFFMGMSRSIFGSVVMVLSLDLNFLMMFLFVMVVRLFTEIKKHVIIFLSIELQGIDLFRSGQQCQYS